MRAFRSLPGGIGLYLLLFLVVGLASLLVRFLLKFYRAETTGPQRSPAPYWDFDPQELWPGAYTGLALSSLLGLYLELLMIRWISAEIPVFAYLKNFVLIACFLGFGLGCYLCRRPANLLSLLAPLGAVAALVTAPLENLRHLITNLDAFVGNLAEVETRGLSALPHDWATWKDLLATLSVALPLFCLIVLAFVPIGQMVGSLLEGKDGGIRRYTVNILASLAGILLFTLLGFLSQPPWVWLAVAGAALVALMWRQPRLRWTAAIGMVCVASLPAMAARSGPAVFWSPYQKLTVLPEVLEGEVAGYLLLTNASWYQQTYNLSPDFVGRHPELFRGTPIEWNPYNLPARFYRNPQSVLVLGAGTGNDVAASLRNGAAEVTAVEIDPQILRLGRALHFEHPYSSRRVQVVNDDARSFLQTSRRKFDLILFSLLDSHTTNPYFSNIRIDNYVYTLEAMQAARQLLKPDGIMIVKFSVETPWIGGRIRRLEQGNPGDSKSIGGRLLELLEAAFGRPPLQVEAPTPPALYGSPGRFFVSGSQERISAAMKDPALAEYVAAHGSFKISLATMTTDDWPYFYQKEPGIPTIVVLLAAVLLPLCWGLLRATGTTGRQLEWHFFFLGAGFLLMETQIISKMALLFGTTWMVNAVAIATLLLLIVGANAVVEWRPDFPIAGAYAGIFLTLLAGYLTPVRALLFPSMGMKILAATLVLCLPVFFAGIVFVRSFAQAGFRGEALGSNLFGALAGGLLEAASFWFGMRSLLLLAGGLYLASWLVLASRREQVRAALPEVPTPAA
jgi:SAM-dependent methyltransferase